MRRLARHWQIVLLGVAAYLAFLLATLPAVQLTSRLSGQIPGLRMAAPTGTIWHGHADWLTVNHVRLDDVSWDASVWRLFTAHLAWHVEAHLGDGFARGKVTLSPDGSATVSDFRAAVSVADAIALTPYRDVPAHGDATVRIDHLVFDDGQAGNVTAEAVVNDLHVDWVGKGSLGGYRMTLKSAGDRIQGNFQDTGGPFSLTGTVDVRATGDYDVRGQIAARPSADPVLAQALDYLGKAGPDGKHDFNFAGRL
ncbi:MAG: type II secretion system protein N [Gammaproteobacteria bacterium]|jgi:hypothetical protein